MYHWTPRKQSYDTTLLTSMYSTVVDHRKSTEPKYHSTKLVNMSTYHPKELLVIVGYSEILSRTELDSEISNLDPIFDVFKSASLFGNLSTSSQTATASMVEKFALIPEPKRSMKTIHDTLCELSHFSHLFHGLLSGEYSNKYIASEVISSTISEEDLLTKQTAIDMFSSILELHPAEVPAYNKIKEVIELMNSRIYEMGVRINRSLF